MGDRKRTAIEKKWVHQQPLKHTQLEFIRKRELLGTKRKEAKTRKYGEIKGDIYQSGVDGVEKRPLRLVIRQEARC